jgi:hypothetical protein
MKTALRQMLSEADGSLSMARCTLAVVVVWVILKSVAFNSAAIAHGGAPVPFDATDVAMLTSAIAGKVAQAILGERK